MELDRLLAYAYFHGSVKGWTESVEQHWMTADEAVVAMRQAITELEQKLSAIKESATAVHWHGARMA